MEELVFCLPQRLSYKYTDLPAAGNGRLFPSQKKERLLLTKKLGKKWFNKHKCSEQAAPPDRLVPQGPQDSPVKQGLRGQLV